MQVTDELRVLVEAEVDKAIQEFQRIDKSIDKTEKSTASLSAALDKLSGKSLLLSTAVSGAGIASIKLAGDIEQTQTALEVLLRDGTQASLMFADWQQFAAKTPFQMDDISRAGKQLLAFNIEAGKVTPTLRTIGDIAAGTGSSISELAEIYGKAAVQGRLFAEDINQFQGRGIPIVQALAQSVGTTESAIKEMVAAGKVGFPELEKAFASLSGTGGKFEGMMEKLSDTTLGKFSTATDNAKMALASFGELLLPIANDVLDAATGMFEGIANLDEGTKRFVLGAGTVIAISGPVIGAVKGITAAFGALAANPYLIAVTATIAGISLIGGAIAKQRGQIESLAKEYAEAKAQSDYLIDSYARMNPGKTLDAKTTQDLIRLYPELSEEMGEYGTSIDDVREKLAKYNLEKAKEIVAPQLSSLQKLQDAQDAYYSDLMSSETDYQELAKYAAEYGMSEAEYQKRREVIAQTEAFARREYDGTAERFEEALRRSNEIAKVYGLSINKDLSVIEIPPVKPELDLSSAGSESVKKRWQQWFEEVTGVKEASYKTGAEAGRNYTAGLDQAFSQAQNLAGALEEKLDLAGILKGQQDRVQKGLSQLLTIDSENINQSFTLQDNVIQALIARYKELGTAIRAAENSEYIADMLDSLSDKVTDLGKSEKELTIAQLTQKDATEEQIEAASSLIDQYARKDILMSYAKQLDEIDSSQDKAARSALVAAGATEEELQSFDAMVAKLEASKNSTRSWEEVFSGSLSRALENTGAFAAGTSQLLGELGTQFAGITFDGVLQGLDSLGEALGKGADAGESLQGALASMAQQILNQLPVMFLQAGLQLIAQNQWPLGLGFIAAAGATGLISGYVKGKTDTVTANAQGGAYDTSGAVPFAKGSTFTDSVVNSPTYFKFASGEGFSTGLMGEAGPEAIMPLSRGPDGSLGVRASGGGESPQVCVIINNNTGEQVSTRESTDDQGNRKIEVMIGKMINNHLSGGRADGALKGRYGLRVQGQ